MLVEGTDMPAQMTYRQAGRKAVAMCVSDFAAKGIRPDSFLVSLGLRKGVTEAQVKELGLGFRDAEREWGVRLAGGDTNESKELVIDCSMFGFAERMVTRSGAKPGDVLVVTGKFGLQPAGLKALAGGVRASQAFASKAKNSVLKPTPDLEVGLAVAGFLSSSMDSSDGLARSIHTLAKASGVGFVVDVLPEADGVRAFAGENGLSREELVMDGGEEYVIVGTVPPRKLGSARRAVERAGGELLVIGEATKSKRVDLVLGRSRKELPDKGWTHLGA